MMHPERMVSPDDILPYEQRLDQDVHAALLEGSMHSEKESAVHKSLQRIAAELDRLGIAYAVSGGMALFVHGHRRFTEDVDILVSRDGLKAIHDALEGLGYVPPFKGGKNLRDTRSGVRIKFLVQGDYPGDGKPKPIAFPDPSQVAVNIDGICFLSLSTLIELKLASGMTNPRRGQDLVDVQGLIEHLNLPESFAVDLDPFVQEKFRELWTVVHDNPE